MMLKKYDPQLQLDFEAAEDAAENAAVKRALQEGLPPGAILGGPLEVRRHFKEPLMGDQERADKKARTVAKRRKTIRAKTEKILAPINVAGKATALITYIEGVEAKINENAPYQSLYPDIEKIRDELARLNVLVGGHRDMLGLSPARPVYVDGEENGTVAESFIGALEFYREILAYMASGKTASGREAQDMHARDMLQAKNDAPGN